MTLVKVDYQYADAKPTGVNAKKILEKLETAPLANSIGWMSLPENYDRDEFDRIKLAAAKINSDSDFLVCIGIGGSYLGHRAVIEALGNSNRTQILYAGNSLSTHELEEILDIIKNRDWSINVISKSGTTMEPAIAFRILKKKLIKQYGEAEAFKRIYATTDIKKGALHDEAVTNGYERFVVPDDIGGRYSVLTAVGLLPIATAGIDIDELMAGAAKQMDELKKNNEVAVNYAAYRNALYDKGVHTEILAVFEPQLSYFAEWWKQLAGESEGKDHKGIFPASVVYTTDLHSLGQYVQQGRRDICETVLRVEKPTVSDIIVDETDDNADGLNYLAGKTLAEINAVAARATMTAHHDGEINVLQIVIPDLTPRSIGALIYFFEYSIAVSGVILGVNPFDQPGVEDYKTNMFRLLGKPGF